MKDAQGATWTPDKDIENSRYFSEADQNHS
jgi:hypothetical protein